MIKALINWLNLREGDILLDPFCGSGTALVEAKTVGVGSVGIDIAPICCLISQVKCDLLDLPPDELERYNRDEILFYFDKKLKKSEKKRIFGKIRNP